MGFIKNITGITGAERAEQRNYEESKAAALQTAENNQRSLAAAARAAASQQQMEAARAIAEDKAQAALSTPLQTADVELTPTETPDQADARRRRVASFGQDYETGVSI
jgi:hypothetical protein